MARCARGCCATQREHYQSLGVASADRKNLTKTTVDEHGTHDVDVVEHWQDRQDVTVKPKTHKLKLTQTQGD